MVDVLNKGWVKAIATISTPPTMVTGDRYILSITGTLAWAGIDANSIAEYDGSNWIGAVPPVGLQQYDQGTSTLLEWHYDSIGHLSWAPAKRVRWSSLPTMDLSDIDMIAQAMGAALEIDIDYSLGGDLALGAKLVIFSGGTITLGAHALTLNAMQAGNYRCFDAGNVVILNACPINVRWFGALGDGMTDDTAAINAAIACALACTVNGTPISGQVYAPTGVYAIGPIPMGAPVNAAVIASPSTTTQGFALRGDGGRASIFLSIISGGGTMLFIGNAAGDKMDGVSIVDMGFQSTFVPGGMGAASEDQLVNLNFCRDAVIERCAFVGGANTQLYVGAAQGTQISDCDFFGYLSPDQTVFGTSAGIVLNNSTADHAGQAARINNCIIRDFRNDSHDAIGINLGIFGGGDAPGATEVAVVDCDLEDCDIIAIDNGGRNRFTRNSIETSGMIATAEAGHVNAGGGSLTSHALLAGAQLGVYRIVCTSSASSGTFTVYDPIGNPLTTTLTTGTAFADQIGFTIMASGGAFNTGDILLFAVELDPTTPMMKIPTIHSVGSVAMAFGNTGSTVSIGTSGLVKDVGVAGTYLLFCNTAGGSPMFSVYDPDGNRMTAMLAVGMPFTLSTAHGKTWIVQIGGSGFAVGDYFLITAVSDVMFSVGPGNSAQASLYAQNTISMDGVGNATFFDLIAYSYIQILDNEFITVSGRAIYCGAGVEDSNCAIRGNTQLDARTAIYFRPGLADGVWMIKDNLETEAVNWSDIATVNSPAPSVANLQTLILQNTAATALSNFAQGFVGQELAVIVDEIPLKSTFVNGGNILMTSGANEPAFATSYLFRAATSADPTSTPIWRQIGPSVRTLQTETAAYLARASSLGAAMPPPLVQYAIDDVVLALKAASLWSTLDALWLFAVNDLKLASVNMIAAGTYDITWHGSSPSNPTFAPYYGVTGIGANNNYGDPALSRVAGSSLNFQANSASLSVWSPAAAVETNYAIGTAAGSVARIAPHWTGDAARERVNVTTTVQSAAGTTSASALVTGTRITSTSQNIYVNAVAGTADTSTGSLPMSADPFYIMRDASTYYTKPIALAAIGGGRNPTQEAAFYAALQPFMTFIGLV